MNDFHRRARNTLLGLALGDAISWPAMFHRSRLLPAWTRRIRREIDLDRETNGVLTVPVPFSLNQPRATLGLCPTDDTEWAAWTIRNLLAHGCRVERSWVIESWRALAYGTAPVRGWVSTQAALDNLRRGLTPPQSGNDNPQYVDDGALCRAVPIGIAYAGRPADAEAAAAAEASVTNSEEGVWVACAVAAAVSVACMGGNTPAVLDAALQALPRDSWPRKLAERALGLRCESMLEVVAEVLKFQSVEYSDASIGPETLAAALAIVSCAGDRFHEAVTGATAVARGADTLPAIVGAITGGLAQDDPVSGHVLKSLETLRGICLPELAGVHYIDLVHTFVETCSASWEELA